MSSQKIAGQGGCLRSLRVNIEKYHVFSKDYIDSQLLDKCDDEQTSCAERNISSVMENESRKSERCNRWPSRPSRRSWNRNDCRSLPSIKHGNVGEILTEDPSGETVRKNERTECGCCLRVRSLWRVSEPTPGRTSFRTCPISIRRWRRWRWPVRYSPSTCRNRACRARPRR